MENCIFCRIVRGEIPCSKVWEDDSFISFLDINPATRGMTIVIPKVHCTSKLFENDEDVIKNIMLASKKVSNMLKDYLDVGRIGLIFEGLDIDHLHAKLIPISMGRNIKEILNSQYPKPTIEELNNMALEISKYNR